MTRNINDPARHTATRTRRLIRAPPNSRLSAGLAQQAILLLSSQDLIQVIAEIPLGEDRQKLIDKINRAYLLVNVQDKHFLTLFGDFCSAIKQLPPSVSLSAELDKDGNIPLASGGLMDVWRGQYRGAVVAIKAFRPCSAQNLDEAEKILWKRVPTWKKLAHPNIAAFHGVTTGLFRLALVYDWGENGNIMDYIESHPQAPRLVLLAEVAGGLQYLHSVDVTHGNLKGANVLIDGSGHVRLTDYGLAPINANPNLSEPSPTTGNSRWLAPEIINPPNGATNVVESKSGDVFAFGMLGIQVFTGQLPFGACSDVGVARRISSGERPELPQNAEDIGLTAQMQRLLQMCWRQDPERRPTIDEVVRRCELLLGNNHAPQPAPPLTTTGGEGTHPDPPRVTKWWMKLVCGWA